LLMKEVSELEHSYFELQAYWGATKHIWALKVFSLCIAFIIFGRFHAGEKGFADPERLVQNQFQKSSHHN